MIVTSEQTSENLSTNSFKTALGNTKGNTKAANMYDIPFKTTSLHRAIRNCATPNIATHQQSENIFNCYNDCSAPFPGAEIFNQKKLSFVANRTWD